MRTIYYAIMEKAIVPSDATDAEIEDIIKKLADGKEFVWSEKDDILEEK